MGLFDYLKNELIDIIEYPNENSELLVSRFDRGDHEIKMGAKLIVRPGQNAVFVNEGEIADIFTPGTYTLETQNVPILATLKGWKYGFNSPFKAEVYFIRVTEQLDRKWGTPNPVIMRDADFGMVRLRCRGNFSYKIGLSKQMISRFVGAKSVFKREDIESQIRTKIVSEFSDALGELKIPALDLLSQYNEISQAVKEKMINDFESLGLDLLSFVVENITLPDSVLEAMDKRGSISALGDMNTYTQFKAAEALDSAAKNESGFAGQMMGMVVGGQMAGQMGNMVNQTQQSQQNNQQTSQILCPKCKAKNSENAKFCSSCGASLSVSEKQCVKCSKPIGDNAKFCPHCGSKQELKCQKCGVELSPGAKFCPECGEKQ